MSTLRHETRMNVQFSLATVSIGQVIGYKVIVSIWETTTYTGNFLNRNLEDNPARHVTMDN